MSKKEEREKNLLKELTPDPNIGEKVLFVGLCTVQYSLDKTKYEKGGAGMAQILQNNFNNRVRILIRSANDLNKPLLNSYILPIADPKLYLSTGLQFDSINDNPVEKRTYIVNFINEESAEKFKKAFQYAIACNTTLLKQKGL
ncbi:Ran-specific GTPase-activating protein [Tritrichomonas musculus]|uniref:Ran-specific GTPase-activating protein n=1 Tax=Tritrichomonas musculus TaxID=1915356 RepID=A0ABR2KQC2_9EUKA